MMRELHESTLIQGSGDLWRKATSARFLEAVGDGTLPQEAFQRWLVQDYHFAKGLTSFQSVLTAKTPRPAQKLLIGGLLAMDYELDWFENHAQRLGLDLDTPVHPICHRYVDYLIASAYTHPFPVSLAILFGVEVSYLYAWGALEPNGPYTEFIERWSNPKFRIYVKGLGEFVERFPHPDRQREFNEVLRHERDFWRMTWEG